ncbi:MAG TPA: NADH-quinone oxidoreductase subunit J [Sedimenticola sp.]|nr:NADH-quinone oxidoreductase subunit J [Sedimenticola sp.]
MTFELFVFYVFAAILVFAAVMVITRRNPVQSALFLVLAFFTSAGIWLLAEAEFLALVLVLVYVGAVMVLFLFVVMMLDIEVAALKAGFIRYLPLGVLIALLLAMEILLVVGPENFGLAQFPPPAPHPADYSNTAELGRVLYTVYMYPFEIAAVILLVGIIAAIGLTLRKRPRTKYQNPSLQVRVKKGPDRIRVVKMEAEE